MGKRKPRYNVSGDCPLCGRTLEDWDVVMTTGWNTEQGAALCDACADLLRAVNGFTPKPRRKYEPFYEQEHLTLDEIEGRIRGYQLTVAGYLRLLEEQRNRCAICNHRPQHLRELVIDHNHRTGQVRGLLCSKCNTALGLFRDSPDVLDAAIEYLEMRGCYGLDSLREDIA